jgi:hypothetical protein
MKSLFIANSPDSLYNSWVYSRIIDIKYGYDSDLIWMPTLNVSWEVSDLFDSIYTIPRMYFDSLSWNTRFDLNGISNMMLMKLILYRSGIEMSEYENIVISKDTTLREQEILRMAESDATVTVIEEGVALYRKNLMHGESKEVDNIFCHFPSLLEEFRPQLVNKIKRNNINEISESIHSKEWKKSFMKNINNLNVDLSACNFDMVYLGQLKDKEKQIAEGLSKSLNPAFSLGFKPHPRDENKNKINDSYELIETKLPVEVIYPFIGSPVIVTHSSTAAFRLAKIYESDVILVVKLYYNSNENFQKKHGIIESIFDSLKLENLHFARDNEEAIKLINHSKIGESCSADHGSCVTEIDSMLSI